MGRQATNGKATRTPRAAEESAQSQRHDLNNRLFFRLFQAANIYEAQATKQLNISAVQGAVLGALSRDIAQGMPFADLYTYLGVSRQNLDAVLKGLERAQYAERIENESDRRVKIVRLTPKGIEAWRDLRERTIEFFRQGTRGISAEQLSDCAETLTKIVRALKDVSLQ